jgi:DNA sulfur modification protein DndB
MLAEQGNFYLLASCQRLAPSRYKESFPVQVDGNTQSLKLPALRAHMGGWIYYICLMKMRDIASRISIASEIYTSKPLQDLLQKQLAGRQTKEIKTYLLSQPQRFFNALVVGTYGGNPNWYELAVRTDDSDLEPLPEYTEGTLGILKLEGSERLWAIDGQHKVAGIKLAVKEDPQIGDEEVCVIFIAGVTSQHRDDNPVGYERTYRLFTALNRYVKSVSKRDIIALDEDDIIAILTSKSVEDHKLFHDKVSTARTRSIPIADKESMTTIEVLYDILDIYLRVGSLKSWQLFKTTRPSDEAIANLYKRATEFWNMMIEHFPPLQELKNSEPKAGVAGKYRLQGGHLLFRPIGLLMIVRILRYLTESGMQLAEAIRVVSQVPMEVSTPPWAELLWDTAKKRMITTQKNRKVAEKLLFYSVGGELRRLRASPDSLRREYAGILNRASTEVELPRYS